MRLPVHLPKYVVLILATAIALFGLGNKAQAVQFASPSEFTASAGKSAKPAKKKKSAKSSVTFHNGSAESVPERERRLKRECKGRSNSGLCEGFTR